MGSPSLPIHAPVRVWWVRPSSICRKTLQDPVQLALANENVWRVHVELLGRVEAAVLRLVADREATS